MKKVCVVGLGYIGLPTSIILAESGYDVVGFDINIEKVRAINNEDPVIQEPEIFPRLKNAMREASFRATAVVEQADYFVIAVPTPITAEKKADLSYVWASGISIADVLKKGDVVILESTSSVGTTEKLAQLLYEKTGLRPLKDFFIGYCPERVLPGNIFYELVYNDRVIGGLDNASSEKIAEFYRFFVKGELIKTDAKTAEMVKLVENSSRDVEIAFAHQVASMAHQVGINPYELIAIANRHPRVNILTPRCGVGGHCIAVDPWFLIESFPEQSTLLKMARNVNDKKPHEVVTFVKSLVDEFILANKRPCKVAVLGLTYKPNIDDLRESPALEIAHFLEKDQAIVLMVADPNVSRKNLPNELQGKFFTYEHAIESADIVLLLVAHDQFKDINWNLLLDKKLIDFSGLNNKAAVKVYCSASLKNVAEYTL